MFGRCVWRQVLGVVIWPVVVISASTASAQPARQQIEADWQRHDEQRLAQIRAKGTVRFVQSQLQWPGAQRLPTGRAAKTGSSKRDTKPAGRLGANASRDWSLRWPKDLRLGYGKNEITLLLQAAKPFDAPLQILAETVVFTPQRPVSQTVLRRTMTSPGPIRIAFDIRHEGAAALVVTARLGKQELRSGETFFVHPVQETLDRAERLLADFHDECSRRPDSAQPRGADRPTAHHSQSAKLAATRDLPRRLAMLRERTTALAARELASGPLPQARKALYRQARWLARGVALSNPLMDFDSLLLVKRFSQQSYPDVCLNHMPWCSRPGGNVCVISPPRPHGQSRRLLDGQLGPGHVHGMDLWFGANRVVFGYAKSETNEPPAGWLNRAESYRLRRTVEPTHLFEVGIDGKNLRQLTTGQWSDLDPTYLPSGDVAFVSERCGYSLQCNELDKDETSCNLYTVRPDGTGIRRLSVTKDGDYLPHALDNGLIAYTRWEYQERLWANIQSIWTVRPDGTGADALFKQHFNNPWALEDVRSIPGTDKLVAIAAGHHTLATGPVVIIDPGLGINNPAGIRIVTPGVNPPEGGMSGRVVADGGVMGLGGFYQTPWPLSEKYFLVSYTYGGQRDEKGYAIYLVDVYGTRELLYRDPNISCSIPIPLRPRRKPPVLTDAADPALTDSTTPANDDATCMVTNIYEDLEGVKPGTIRYLRIASRLAWPYDNQNGGQRYEPDVKRVMINWTPARIIGTVPVEADGSAHFRVPVDTPVYFQALDADHMEVRRMRSFVSFQPGEVRGCTGCHETRSTAPANIPRAAPLAMQRPASIPVPPSWGTGTMSFLRDVQPVLSRHCVRCHGGLKPAGGIDFTGGLTANSNRAWQTINEKKLIARSNVGDDSRVTLPYAFGSCRSKLVYALSDKTHASVVRLTHDDWDRLVSWIDLNGPYHARFINKRAKTPAYDLACDGNLAGKLLTTHRKRCAGCHRPEDVSRTDWIDIDRPADSLFLSAPLSKQAGGTGRCEGAPYRSTRDPAYQANLRLVQWAVKQTWARPRRDVQTLPHPSKQLRLTDATELP